MTYATTFSGIGGWELGLNACGWDLKWQCEREPFCQALLKERFGVPICPDVYAIVPWIRRVRPDLAQVDALIGSPPCQPFSVAGKQRGVSDERHLYGAFRRAVGVLRPRYVLMEQVPAVLSLDGGRAFGQYIGGLVALGYSVNWHCIPACAVGAPHPRNRLWIIAYSARLDDGRIESALRQGVSGISRKFRGSDFWSTEPDILRVVNGVSARMDAQYTAIGNAVVPQIPFIIGQAINRIESGA
jgi:DNA (cytosine-5)-methyltransferase 1